MKLEDLEIYQLAREISRDCWETYSGMSWENKKVIGNQFIEAVDSVGANIAEGWGRFHFLDKNKFNYNSRGSLMEAIHWLELLVERKLIEENKGVEIKKKMGRLHLKLNNYINSTREQVRK